MLFWLAEERANVADADGAIHAAADPVLVLVSLRQPVPEDSEGFPDGLLTNWNTEVHSRYPAELLGPSPVYSETCDRIFLEEER